MNTVKLYVKRLNFHGKTPNFHVKPLFFTDFIVIMMYCYLSESLIHPNSQRKRK